MGAICVAGGISGGPDTVCGAVTFCGAVAVGVGVELGVVAWGAGGKVVGGTPGGVKGVLSNFASAGDSLVWLAVNRLGSRLRRQSR